MHYVILDEIQLVEGFEYVLNGLLYEKNIAVEGRAIHGKYYVN